MPISEYREIRFDATALRAALQARLAEARSRQGEPPSAATVVAAAVAEADPLRLVLDLGEPAGAAEPARVTMEAVEVAAALIRACMRRGIRLPRHGAKAVKAIPGGVALVVAVTHPDDPGLAEHARAA